MVSKEVIIRYAGGETKKVVLGEEKTCVLAQPRGWGTSCKALVLKEDGFYHCRDCGLVFKKPVQKTKSEAILAPCDCRNLINFLEWYFNECYGYDCPSSYYRCGKCGRVYKAPHFSREASIRLQESEAAKKQLQWHHNYEKEEQAKRISKALENAGKLKENLKQVPRAIREKILKELIT